MQTKGRRPEKASQKLFKCYFFSLRNHRLASKMALEAQASGEDEFIRYVNNPYLRNPYFDPNPNRSPDSIPLNI